MISALKANHKSIKEYKLSRYLVVTDKFFSPSDRKEKRIIFATRSGTVTALDTKQWEHIYTGDFNPLSNRLKGDLKTSKIIVDSDEDELISILRENRQDIANSRRLSLGVMPSADCQLDCFYCGQVHKKKSLSSDNQKLFLERVRSILERRPYRELKVCWTGAEPLLALDVMRKMSQKFLALAEEFDCEYISDIMTNGLTLTPKVARVLSRECHVTHADVTLDGPDFLHDKRRYTKGGKSTFWKIFKNIIAIAQDELIGMEIKVRCNVDHRNYDGVLALLRLLAKHSLHNRLSGFYIVPVCGRGSLTERIPQRIEEIALLEIKCFKQMKHFGFSNINLIPWRLKKACFALGPESEIVDAFGNLFNCADVVSIPRYEGPAGLTSKDRRGGNIFSIGTLAGGEKPGKRNLLAGFNDRIERGEVPCGDCRVLPLCGGACPRRWHDRDTPCPTFKYNIEKRLMLEYIKN